MIRTSPCSTRSWPQAGNIQLEGWHIQLQAGPPAETYNSKVETYNSRLAQTHFSCLRSLTYCCSARDSASNPLELSRNRTPIDIITTSTRVSRSGDKRPPPGSRRASSRAGGSRGAGSLDSTRPRTCCQVSADGSPHTKHWSYKDTRSRK